MRLLCFFGIHRWTWQYLGSTKMWDSAEDKFPYAVKFTYKRTCKTCSKVTIKAITNE